MDISCPVHKEKKENAFLAEQYFCHPKEQEILGAAVYINEKTSQSNQQQKIKRERKFSLENMDSRVGFVKILSGWVQLFLFNLTISTATAKITEKKISG